MHRFIVEIYTPAAVEEVLDHFKDGGGHANLVNVRPDLDDHQLPGYVSEPYPPEAYRIPVVLDPTERPPDCPYCDGSGNLGWPDDLAATVRARHPDWDDAEVDAEVARVMAELDAQDARHDRNRERIKVHAKVRKQHPSWDEERVTAEVERLLAKKG